MLGGEARAAELVSNASGGSSANLTINTNESAQGFYAGTDATLTSIDLVNLDIAPSVDDEFTVELWSATSTGTPNSKIADLEPPSDISTGAIRFDAPDNTRLTGGNTYFVFVKYSGGGTLPAIASHTGSATISGEAEWNIGNHYIRTRGSSDAWGSFFRKIRIRVNGSVILSPVDPPVVGPIGGTEIWSATLTVGSSQGSNGFLAGQYGSLSDTTFDHRGTSYTIDDITDGAGDGRVLDFSTTADHPSSDTAHLTL